MDIITLACSLVVLLYSSDKLIDEVLKLALKLGISAAVLSMTLVAVGTSLPEVSSSSVATYKGYSSIAIGNVIGSNICNIGLVLAIAGILGPIQMKRKVYKREAIIMLGVTTLFCILGFLYKGIGQVIGIGFILGFFAFTYYVFRFSKPDEHEIQEEEIKVNLLYSICLIVVMLFLLSSSSSTLVSSVVSLASSLGISEAVIAVSVVAFGTSVPELAVSISAGKKGKGDVLVGNVVGSNISNVLLVTGVSSQFGGLVFEGSGMSLDLLAMFGFCALMLFYLRDNRKMTKIDSIVMLACYCLYIAVRVSL